MPRRGASGTVKKLSGARGCRSSEAVRARGSAPRLPLGQLRHRIPSTSSPAVGTGLGLARQRLSTGHFVMFPLHDNLWDLAAILPQRERRRLRSGYALGPVKVGLQPDSGRVGEGGHPARPRISSRLSLYLRVAPRTAPDDRCPMALHSLFSDYLPLYIRGKGNPLSSFCGSGASDGHPLASVAGLVRQVDIGLSPLDPRVRPGRLAAPDGLPAGRSRSVSAVRLDSTVVRAHVSAADPPPPQQQRDGSRPRPQPRRLQPPSSGLGAEAWTDAPLPCLIADRAQYTVIRLLLGHIQQLPFGRGQAPYVLRGHAILVGADAEVENDIVT